MTLHVKNWKHFQHYKDRKPPWIKLHRELLDDYDFQQLPDASARLAPMLWLLASEHIDGVIDMSIEAIAYRLHMTVSKVQSALQPLVDKGFIIDASNMIADCKQTATPSVSASVSASVSSSASWRSDFELYRQSELAGFNALLADEEWVAERESFHPNLDVRQSVCKAHKDFWGTEAGWKHKKRARSAELDWKATYNNALTMRGNQVWKPRREPGELRTTL